MTARAISGKHRHFWCSFALACWLVIGSGCSTTSDLYSAWENRVVTQSTGNEIVGGWNTSGRNFLGEGFSSSYNFSSNGTGDWYGAWDQAEEYLGQLLWTHQGNGVWTFDVFVSGKRNSTGCQVRKTDDPDTMLLEIKGNRQVLTRIR